MVFADVNDVFTIENGALKVTTFTTNGTDYTLANGVLSVNNGFSDTITSTATFNNEVQTKEIDFIYDHNGMRTGMIVSENGKVEITEYTLHGKLITHLTKRVVNLDGLETIDELHFFYDAQSRPAFVEYCGVKYRYIHNLQGDIVAIVDAAGNPVVEYKYDAWGKPIYEADSLLSSLVNLNPFRYRGYVWDEETELYYLRSRYYCAFVGRFMNCDSIVMSNNHLSGSNLYVYCRNNSVCLKDHSGYRPIEAFSVQSETKNQRKTSMNYMKAYSRNVKWSTSCENEILSAEFSYSYNRTPYETVCNNIRITIIPRERVFSYLLSQTEKPSFVLAIFCKFSTIEENGMGLDLLGSVSDLSSYAEDVDRYERLSTLAKMEVTNAAGFVIVEHEWYYLSDVSDGATTAARVDYEVWNGEDVFHFIK